MVVCSHCGQESESEARFCAACGSALAPAVRREERKVVSIVFADLVGSTAAAERSDPEDVRAVLAAHHARVRAELERYGGTVEKFIGDAVVAVFGAPVVHEDDPERAVRAALAVRDVAREADAELRVAVNTGEALVSLDAHPLEGEGMVAGDVVNTAARIQSAAPINGVLVGETTYRATAHLIEYREAASIDAKGKAEPVVVWEAVAPRSRFGSDVELAPLAALVGRQREVDVLRDALTRAREEREPQLVTLVGVPGIGKSRLVAELLQIVGATPELITWRQGRCLSYGDGISFWALSEMTKAQAGILEGDPADEASRKLTDAVAVLVQDPTEAEWVVGHLRPLVGLGSDAGGGGESRGEAFAAWRRFFEGMGGQRPTVLVFEDLHWADDGLLDFIDALVERATGVPLFVLCTARPELLVRRPNWGGGKPNTLTLSLSALSDEETARLIAGHLSQAVLPAEMQQTLLGRAEGNPLFAEEYIRMLKDRGLLLRDGETWRLDATEAEVPETVQGIIAARLDALESDEKALLQAASVVGKVFWLGSVAAIAGISPWDAEEQLHALERKELVRRDRRASVAGETEYSVRHVLVRDVAYGQIPRARRADLHLRAAQWIESLGDERTEDRAEMLAHHYVTALELRRAAGGDAAELETPARLAFREAGNRAYALSSLEAAATFHARALELWPEDDPDYPRLLLERGRALAWLRAEGISELQEAADRFRAAGEVEAAAEAEANLGDVFRFSGRQQTSLAHHERAIALIADLPETRVTAWIRALAWRAALLAGQRVPLEESMRILALAEELGTAEEVLMARITFGLAQGAHGDPYAEIETLDRALELARRANSHLVGRASANLGSILSTVGELDRAGQIHREGVELARRLGSRLEYSLVAECALDDFIAGDWDAAGDRAISYLEHRGAGQFMDSVAYLVLGAVATARGDGATAEAYAAAMIDSARENREPQSLLATLGEGARLALDSGEPERARLLLDELIAAYPTFESFEVDVTQIGGFLAAAVLGRTAELGSLLDRVAYGNPWVEACKHIVAGRLDEAGDALHAREAHAYAALTRLLEAELVGSETRCLPDAIAFFERAGATSYLERAVRLLEASA